MDFDYTRERTKSIAHALIRMADEEMSAETFSESDFIGLAGLIDDLGDVFADLNIWLNKEAQ